MKPFICKNLISLSLKNSQHLNKPPTLYSFSVLFYSSSSPKKAKTKISLADYLINEHHFSPESALQASTIKSYLKNPENSNLVLSFLKKNGFSNTHIEKIVAKAPNILSANLDATLKPKIEIFQEYGFSSSEIVDIISVDPNILRRSADNCLRQSMLVLTSVLGSNANVFKALKRSGWFLTHDLEKSMVPNIEILKSCGISSSQIVKHLFSFPRFFLHKPENMKIFVQRVNETGFDRKSKMFLTAIRTIGSMRMENWERKFQLFRSLGFSKADILSMFRSMPQVFAISERKTIETMELLLSRENVDISYIVKNPALLLCSNENCLKPRLRVYDILNSRNLLPKKAGLATICKISKRKFLDKFVLPYQDKIGDSSFRTTA